MALVISSTAFIEQLAESSKTDNQRVRIAKIIFLNKNRDDILQAEKVGYNFAVIAEVATAALLKTDTPKSFMGKTKEGKEVEKETKFSASEIKKFCKEETK